MSQRDVSKYVKALSKATPKENADRIIGRVFLRVALRIQARARTFMRGPRPKFIAVVTGRLLGSIAVDRSRLPWSVSTGTDVEYGPVHELGAPAANIPARPYLEPSAAIETKRLPDELARAWEGEVGS